MKEHLLFLNCSHDRPSSEPNSRMKNLDFVETSYGRPYNLWMS
jgi:hypothetical protein